MAPPTPQVPLKDHCSVVHDQTLYVYSPEAFQSISLKEDAEWKKLNNSVAASGAQCVYDGASALYVVGGTADASLNYPGLMKYDFGTSEWETITPTDTVTKDRQYHGATFLKASSQILVYAGSQDGSSGLSSGTYTIDTAAPYGVSSYPSGGAPNVNSPILLPWDDSHALMIGGRADNTAVFTFSVADGWQNLGVALPAAIADQTTTKFTLVDGDDGSRVLEQYNLGASPNEVTRIALLTAGGAVASTGQSVGAKKRKRDLTISDWPSYNKTLAPDTTRPGASITQDDEGHAIISGGSDDDPLAIFDERENSWMNATSFFYGSQEPTKISSSSSSSSSLTSATSSASAAASSTAAAVAATATASGASPSSTSSVSDADAEHKSRMMTVLGATLGTICGLAAVLIIILLLLRCKRKKNKAAGGDKGGEKDRLSFADRGVSQQFGGYPGAPPYMEDRNASQTSLAIISGKYGNQQKTHTRGLPSDASTAGLVKKQSPLAYQETLEMSQIGDMKVPPYTEKAQSPPAAVGDQKNPTRSRSSGWSRYFANNEATNLASEPYDRTSYASHNSRLSAASQSEYDTNSRYITQSQAPKFTHPSQIVPPLDVSFANTFDGNRLSRVVTGSPTIGNSREDLSSHGMGVGTPMRAELARANSVSTISSFESRRISHNDAQQTWTPIEGNNWNNRAPSSLYPDSRPQSEVPIGDGASSFYPGDTSSYYPQDGTSSFYPKSQTNSLYPSSLHPNPPMPAQGRDSTVTVFPRGVPSGVSTDEERQKAIGKQDMSWLKF